MGYAYADISVKFNFNILADVALSGCFLRSIKPGIGIQTVQDSPGQFRNWPVVFSVPGIPCRRKFSFALVFLKFS